MLTLIPGQGKREANVFNLFASFDLTSKLMRQLRFNFLPGHAGRENCEGVSEIDHLIEAAVEKIVNRAHRVISKNSQKMTLVISKYGS